MHMIQSGYRGLSLLLDVNADRLYAAALILAALLAGAFLGSLVSGL